MRLEAAAQTLMLQGGLADGIAAEHLLQFAGGVFEDMGNVIIGNAQSAGDLRLAVVLVVKRIQHFLFNIFEPRQCRFQHHFIFNRKRGTG